MKSKRNRRILHLRHSQPVLRPPEIFSRRILAWILIVSMLLPMAGCRRTDKADESTESESATIRLAEPEITAEPAPVLRGVETDRKVVSLIFEGITDAEDMAAIADILSKRHIPAVFFVSGVSASENPEVLQMLTKNNLDIGNYGLTGEKHLEDLPAYDNLCQFEAAQREIKNACGKTPDLVRCNGTTYTEEVLRAVSAAKLKAAVEPTTYLNRKSFQTENDAAVFSARLLRGSIISFKLDQELDASEYGDPGDGLDERPAIDPPPGIRWDDETTEADSAEAALSDVVTWLLDALESQGYSIKNPQKLQKKATSILPKQRDLTAEEQEELNPENYTLPVTKTPLLASEIRAAAPGDFNGAVFVGNEAVEDLEDYTAWRREKDPDFLDKAQFLSKDSYTVESLLESDIGKQLSDMHAQSVWLCLSYSNRSAFRNPAYLSEYRLLIRQIKKYNPDTRIIIMSLLPKVDGYPGISNESRFVLNLMLCGMCREYGFAFVDDAFAVRDDKGALREDYCLALETQSSRLNDAGCEAVIQFIKENFPQ